MTVEGVDMDEAFARSFAEQIMGLAGAEARAPLGAMTQSLTAAWYGGEVSPLAWVVMFAWAIPTALLALRVFRWV
jgi:hypothetical protein